MKQVCLLCERTSPDGNLYCQETYCPAEMSPTIMGQGEWLGDIEIIRPIIVLRSAVLYAATHQEKKVLLKVAHPGTENKERLKRESEFLSRYQYKFLPVLLPPYVGTTTREASYGKAMLRGHLLYFCMFEYTPGEPLRDILTKNPQLWINHVGWLAINLAHAVAFLHHKGLVHFGLSPDNILVRFDNNHPKTPRILLFDLGIANEISSVNQNWYSFFVPPAYTAPELIERTGQPDYRTDVYGLGLILYELLVGEPAFTFKLHDDTEVYRAVQRNHRIKMNRIEDVKAIADIALQAVHQQVAHRQEDATVIAKQLMQYFGKTPEERGSRWPSLNTIMVIVTALLAIAFLLALALSLNSFA